MSKSRPPKPPSNAPGADQLTERERQRSRRPRAQVLTLIPLIQRRRKPSEAQGELIAALSEMLARAKAGTLTSLAFSIEEEAELHTFGMVGRYRTDYMSALGAAALLYRLIEEATHGNLKGFKRGLK